MSLLIPGTNSIKDTSYDVANSLRFNGGSSDDLVRTPSSSGNNNKNTISVWLKRSRVDEEDFIIYGLTSSANRCKITFKSDNKLQINTIVSSSNNLVYETNRLFRDVGSWYHIVIAFDSTLGTAGDRVRLYINGTEETSFATETHMGQNTSNFLSTSGTPVYIGSQASGNYFDGYMAEFVFIDGQQLDATSFGEFNSDSPTIWQPKDVSGLTFGTNGFHLDFENASSLGADVSGNSNNFTVNNLTSIDQSIDTCTNNFATVNALQAWYPTSTDPVLTEGNLKIRTGKGSSSSAGYFYYVSTIGFNTGKWYFEVKPTESTGNLLIGIVGKQPTTNAKFAEQADGYMYGKNGNKRNNNVQSSYGATYDSNDIIGVAVDLDNNKIYFSKNGTFQDSGDPTSGSTGTGSAYNVGTPSEGFYFTCVASTDYAEQSTFEFNYGSAPFSISSGNADDNGFGSFEYDVPAGYLAICTKNLGESG